MSNEPYLGGDHIPFDYAGDVKTIEMGDLAVNTQKWTLTGTGPDGAPIVMEGSGFDVMRRQADGNWKMTIDNPWGTAILD